jgi:hypothetical protein
MDRRLICVLISSLAVLAIGCSKKTEQGPEVLPVTAPAAAPVEAPPPIPTERLSPQEIDGDPGHAQKMLTPDELRELVDPTEAPPPAPTDHRLQLGIDGDPGYTQDELTPEELAEARAAGAAMPQPSYAQQPSEPSHAEQPSEPSDEVDESSNTVYVGGTRAPVYRHHVREEAEADNRREPRPAAQPHRGLHR